MQPQTTHPDEILFREQTNTFSLTVTFENSKLTLTLKDFVDWAIYSKEYTEDCIGGEINRRVDLFDVFAAFSQTHPQCDEENMKEKSHEISKLKKYEFGTIIGTIIESENLPCYKIEREGKITVYFHVMDMIIRRRNTFQNRLSLAKLRDMTQTEISTERSIIEKRQMYDQFNKEIEKQKKEKEELANRITEFEEENIKLKSEIAVLSEELRKSKLELISKNEELEVKIDQIRHDQSVKIQQIRAQFLSSIVANKQESQAKINESTQQLNQRFQQQTKRSWGKIVELEEKLNAVIRPINTLSQQSPAL